MKSGTHLYRYGKSRFFRFPETAWGWGRVTSSKKRIILELIAVT